MTNRRIISVILTIIMVLTSTSFSYASEVTGNSVVPEGYTAIYTIEDLNNIKNNLSGKYILMNDIELTTADYDRNEKGHLVGKEPIGPSPQEPFAGEFDGNGYSITALYGESNEYGVSGMFGYLTGKVCDLKLVECAMYGVDGENETYTGLVAGYVNGGSVENCHVTGEVKDSFTCGGVVGYAVDGQITGCTNAAMVTGDTLVGGIVGSAVNSVIDNCHNTRSVSMNMRINDDDSKRLGGIVGFGTNLTVEDCDNTGEIANTSYYGGGIAGYMTGSISNSNNECMIYAEISGGLAGFLEGDVTGCYNNAELYGGTAGGIIGILHGTAYNCYNTGMIDADDNAGGIAAELEGEIKHCYNAGKVIGNNSGGIIGETVDQAIVEECYNAGTVIGSVNSGGIVGFLKGGSVFNSYNVETIMSTNKYCDGVGGIAGSASKSSEIANTYNLGVIRRANAPGTVYKSPLGMLVGYYPEGTANVENNYVHVKANENQQNLNLTEDAQVLTTKAMKSQESYNGFDFENIWMMDLTNDKYPLPQLKNFPMNGDINLEFDFNEQHVRDLDIQMKTEFQYCKNPIEPEIIVMDGEVVLTENEHYTVEFTDNVNAGTAAAKIIGLNNYEGSVTKTFVIKPLSFETCSIEMEYTTIVRNGQRLNKPKVLVYDSDGDQLLETRDFVCRYDSWPAPVGRYKIEVVFKGNYVGSTDLFYTVVPPAPMEVRTDLNGNLSLKGYDDIKFSWAEVEGASGYDVYFKKSSANKYTFMTSTASTYVIKKDLIDGVKYNFKVVPYYKHEGEKYNSLESKSGSCYTLKKINKPTVTKNDNRVKIKWKNINGETGYQISKAKTKNGTNIIVTFKTTTGTYKNVTAEKGKTFYYKVRAYKVVDGKKVFGPWSNVKMFKR